MTNNQPRRVVVGVTGSLANLSALHAAVHYARRCDVPLLAVRAWLPTVVEANDPRPWPLQLWRQQARNELAISFQDALGGPPTDVDVRYLAPGGEAGPTLVAAANHPDDVLVVGAGRRGRFIGLRSGSVTRYCFTHAGCAVLAVPPPEMIHQLVAHRSRQFALTSHSTR